MSILTAHTQVTNSSHNEVLYSLTTQHMVSFTLITMRLNIPVINTKHFPLTYQILSKKLPSIFSSKCYNEENLPFKKEVRGTEIGHLLEHILLEYLCLEKVSKYCGNVVFNGHTSWDFNRDGRGVFHIHVDVSLGDKDLLVSALDKTILLMNSILESSQVLPDVFAFTQNKQIAQDYQFADSD